MRNYVTLGKPAESSLLFNETSNTYLHTPDSQVLMRHHSRDQSRYVPSQWETSLQCNDLSHWLGAYLESSLIHKTGHKRPKSHNHHDHSISIAWFFLIHCVTYFCNTQQTFFWNMQLLVSTAQTHFNKICILQRTSSQNKVHLSFLNPKILRKYDFWLWLTHKPKL